MSKYYQFLPLKENVYRITSAEGVFFELLVGREKAMLIDTGYGFGDIKAAVREITNKPLVIVNTHGHVDHTSGNCQFEEDIYISPKDMDLCKRHNTPEKRIKSAKLAEHTRNYVTGEEFYGLPEDFSLENYMKGGAGALVECIEGMVFDLGGITMEVFETPGHTQGGLSLLYKEENWLYTGDEVNGFCWLFDNDATDRNTHIKSLEKVIALNPEKIYIGHMPIPVTVEDVKKYIQAAQNADYEKGIPFFSPMLEEGENGRICLLDGYTMEDMGKPGFASIVIGKDK